MAGAYVQEFAIVDGDTSTTNYDAVVAALGMEAAPDGLIVHTSGFDKETGVFRIFDVWESREAGERWMEATSTRFSSASWERSADPSSFTPPTADYWYELHDSVS